MRLTLLCEPQAGYRENGYEHLGSIEGGEFFTHVMLLSSSKGLFSMKLNLVSFIV
jgi:hypothetical protein